MERFNRLAHSIWDCKYHIVWIPKYRRKELYGAKRQIVVETIKQWARIKGIEIIEGHAMPDHNSKKGSWYLRPPFRGASGYHQFTGGIHVCRACSMTGKVGVLPPT